MFRTVFPEASGLNVLQPSSRTGLLGVVSTSRVAAEPAAQGASSVIVPIKHVASTTLPANVQSSGLRFTGLGLQGLLA